MRLQDHREAYAQFPLGRGGKIEEEKSGQMGDHWKRRSITWGQGLKNLVSKVLLPNDLAF